MPNLSPIQREALRGAIKNISDIMSKIDLHRETIKESISEIAEEFDLDKKYVRKMARVYHKGIFRKEISEMEDFEMLYETVFSQEGSNSPPEAE